MHLIQMAISSKPDKRMTLREIYKWIEDKFPYYKFCPKQGWKVCCLFNMVFEMLCFFTIFKCLSMLEVLNLVIYLYNCYYYLVN